MNVIDYKFYSNPKYVAGGRWTGYFKLKEGKYGITGEPGLMTKEAKVGWADSVLIGDIDFEGMIESAKKEANETYDKIESLLKGRPYPVWKEILEKHGQENINEARVEYHNHEVIQDFNEADFHVWGDFYEQYGNSRQEYLQKVINSVMVPFAVLKNGEWFEKGKMGWWATVSDSMGQDNWNAKFQELIAGLPKDTLVTAVDCHI